MFFKRFTLFHVFNFKIEADASWVFISILIGWSLSTRVFPFSYAGHSVNTYQLMALATLAGIIISIIAHEVAHALIAEYYHMPVVRIVLYLFGGVAEMRGEPSHPKGEFLMAIAGPVMSGLMGLFFRASADFYIGSPAVWHVMHYLSAVNFGLAAFNLIPAFPLDGGRALRAAIWHYRKNMVIATRVASALGTLFTYFLISFACFKIVYDSQLMAGMWIGVGALILHGAATTAVRHAENRSLLDKEPVSRFMNSAIVAVSPDMTIHDFVEQYVYAHYQRSFPVVDHGRLVGLIAIKTILPMERHKWHFLHTGSIMEPISEENAVAPAFSAADALDMMQKSGRESLLVMDQGKLLGAIAVRDLATYLSISMKIDDNRAILTSR